MDDGVQRTEKARADECAKLFDSTYVYLHPVMGREEQQVCEQVIKFLTDNSWQMDMSGDYVKSQRVIHPLFELVEGAFQDGFFDAEKHLQQYPKIDTQTRLCIYIG